MPTFVDEMPPPSMPKKNSFEALPSVYILVTGSDTFLDRYLDWLSAEKIYPLRKGANYYAPWAIAGLYTTEGAELIVAWLRENAAEESK